MVSRERLVLIGRLIRQGVILLVAGLTAMTWLSLPLWAQTPAVHVAGPSKTASAALDSAVARSDALFAGAHANGWLDPLLPWLAQERPDPRVLWRAARAEVAAGILSPTREAAEAHHLRAATYARRALEREPTSTEARYWLAVATGRRALRGDFRRILPLAVETYAEAQRLLARDSLHAGAHDIVGKLYSEVRKLPWLVRKLAATVTRQDVLRLASWDAAELHLRRAIALDSTVIVYRADLTQLYLRMDRLAEARAALSALERLPNRTPADTLFKREAREWVNARVRTAR